MITNLSLLRVTYPRQNLASIVIYLTNRYMYLHQANMNIQDLKKKKRKEKVALIYLKKSIGHRLH
jgi:hypothetical protein